MAKTEQKTAVSEHLRALRRVLVVSVAAVAALFVLLFYFACTPLVDFILAPVRARGIEVISTTVSEALMMQFKVCLVAAVVAAMPVIIFETWRFLSPALYPREKRLFALLFVVALGLFVLGVCFCYAFVFPLAIDLFWSASQGVADTLWSVKEYFDFVLSFVLPFGLMFELPVAIYMLARRGLVDYPKMARARKFVVLAIAVVAAVLTPPDVVSQCMLALPMMVLYEVAAQITRAGKFGG